MMKLTDTDKMLLERGWHFHGHNLWSIEIGGIMFAYNTVKGVLTRQDDYDRNLVQTHCDFSSVLALGFSDDWGHPKNRMERDKLKLEHMFSL